MIKILVLDNYDSFTYNLVHIIKELGYSNAMTIARNDKITVEEVGKFDKILLSPGPGIPDEAGILKELIRVYGATKSILGVCLGHQAIAEVYGAQLYNLQEVLHGVSSNIIINETNDYLFQNVPKQFKGAHYHSWAVKADTVTTPIEIMAKDDKDVIMAIKHQQFDVRGVQFHPESIMTEHGEKLIKNWIGNEKKV
jgi:anthranilate synthase component II